MVAKRPRQKAPIPIGQALKKIMRQVDPGPDQTVGPLQRAWGRIVGAQAAQNSRPLTLRQGVLTVLVTNSALIQQMRFQTRSILTAVNAEPIDALVTSIRFKVG